ncbi:hypothetical protein BZB76_6229 [Actinomadura pelletieri DSM 43383]|uniref:EthD domain-containing protein n=1 Tax=Actinomadura pelletieri DSM 43383 TaxID=1120940 RepID=A0A495QBN8_9ACTN|nr:DUF4286 family protein [Actinomadura pelletieri]RKS69090.1 hypothetical protein BZB76_6229 [Actinomadura pelletieri DSM 43383]
MPEDVREGGTEGLLYVLSQPRDGDEDAFHDWYDGEHGPARLALPGVHQGHRYRAVDGRAPSWLAWYDLDLDVLQTPEYRRLRERRSARETTVMAALEVLDRRIYALVDEHGAPAAAPPPILLARAMTVEPAREPDFHAWYVEEHIPALHALPGWRRTRRYALVDGDAPRFLALHEIDDPGVFDGDAYRAATNTPWRTEVMRTLTAEERRVFAYHNSFQTGGDPAGAR